MDDLREFDRAYAEASGDWSDYVSRYGDENAQALSKPLFRLLMPRSKPTKRRRAYVLVKSAIRQAPSWHRPRPVHRGMS
jgi:hypothetical protein